MIHPALIRRQRLILTTLSILIILTILISIRVGYSPLSYDKIIKVLLGEGSSKDNFILLSIRLPRIILTLLTGMALALSGSILQGITRNDLSDPGIIGINSGAGVAIAIFIIVFSLNGSLFPYLVPLAAFTGSIITACFIYIFSYNKKSGFHPINLILVGVGFSMALSGLMIVIVSSAERTKVEFIVKWLSGSIWGADWPYIFAILPWLALLIPYTIYKSKHLDILRLSEPIAIGLGMSVNKERMKLLLAAIALASSAVSVTGGISFIGLMSPHISRRLVGPKSEIFIPVSILLGGWLLLFSDTIGRYIFQPDGIPTGIMTALIGAPYFINLLLKNKK